MSPFAITILLYYWSHVDDFRNGDFSAPELNRLMDQFVKAGLLIPGAADGSETGARYHGNLDALKPYIEALQAVPLPVR